MTSFAMIKTIICVNLFTVIIFFTAEGNEYFLTQTLNTQITVKNRSFHRCSEKKLL